MDVWGIPMLIDSLCYVITAPRALEADVAKAESSGYFVVDISEPFKLKQFFKRMGI